MDEPPVRGPTAPQADTGRRRTPLPRRRRCTTPAATMARRLASGPERHNEPPAQPRLGNRGFLSAGFKLGGLGCRDGQRHPPGIPVSSREPGPPCPSAGCPSENPGRRAADCTLDRLAIRPREIRLAALSRTTFGVPRVMWGRHPRSPAPNQPLHPERGARKRDWSNRSGLMITDHSPAAGRRGGFPDRGQALSDPGWATAETAGGLATHRVAHPCGQRSIVKTRNETSTKTMAGIVNVDVS
jgi:hypothetical protein